MDIDDLLVNPNIEGRLANLESVTSAILERVRNLEIDYGTSQVGVEIAAATPDQPAADDAELHGLANTFIDAYYDATGAKVHVGGIMAGLRSIRESLIAPRIDQPAATPSIRHQVFDELIAEAGGLVLFTDTSREADYEGDLSDWLQSRKELTKPQPAAQPPFIETVVPGPLITIHPDADDAGQGHLYAKVYSAAIESSGSMANGGRAAVAKAVELGLIPAAPRIDPNNAEQVRVVMKNVREGWFGPAEDNARTLLAALEKYLEESHE